jgi:hypothetical protein
MRGMKIGNWRSYGWELEYVLMYRISAIAVLACDCYQFGLNVNSNNWFGVEVTNIHKA